MPSRKKSAIVKHPQSQVERALSTLSPDDLGEWNHLVRFNANYIQLQSWLAQRGVTVSLQTLSNWWAINRPRGSEAIAVNVLSEQFIGTDATSLLQMSAAIAARMIDELKTSLDHRLDAATVETRLTNFVGLLRELRQASSEIHKLDYIADRNALIAAGAFQMAEELRTIFKGSPFEQALETGIHAALTKLSD